MTATDIPVDVEVLRAEILTTYTEVSTRQQQEFIYAAKFGAMGSTIRATKRR